MTMSIVSVKVRPMQDLKQLAAQHPIWSLEEFAQVTNQWLPRFLPEERADSRVREEVNPRLVRQYTTLGMVDAPLKAGREARYTYRHLLQLLVTRRLLTEGYSSGVIAKLLAGKDEPALETLLEGQAQITVAPENPALAFLQGLSERVAPKKKAAAPSGPAPSAPPPPPMAPMPSAAPAFEALEEAVPLEASLEAMPYAPPGSPPSTWTRHELAPGLEVHVRDDFSAPTPTDRQAIATAILELLQADDDRRFP